MASANSQRNTLSSVTKEEKNWDSFAIFNVWANDIQSLFGYSLAASLLVSAVGQRLLH